jgi:hypothetical protein
MSDGSQRDATLPPRPVSLRAPSGALADLMAQQRESLRSDDIVSPKDYLALAKPIVAADGSSPTARSRPGSSRAASRPGTASCSVKVRTDATSENDPTNQTSTRTLVVADDTEVVLQRYDPGRPNRHLHIRDTLTLALKVLEANRREGFTLLEDEQALVDSIAAFATSNQPPKSQGGELEQTDDSQGTR